MNQKKDDAKASKKTTEKKDHQTVLGKMNGPASKQKEDNPKHAQKDKRAEKVDDKTVMKEMNVKDSNQQSTKKAKKK